MTVSDPAVKEQLPIALACLSLVAAALVAAYFFGGVTGKPFLVVTFSGLAGLVPMVPSLMKTTFIGPYHHLKLLTGTLLAIPIVALSAGLAVQGVRSPIFVAAAIGCVTGALIAVFGRGK
jgi:hypothetical protein